MTRPTNMTQPLPNLTTGFLGREAPNPIADPPDPIDRAAGLDVYVPGGGGEITLVQSAETSSTLGTAEIELPGATTAGNLLVASCATRGGGAVATPSGWTAHPDGIIDAGGSSVCGMFYKIADGTETGVVFTPAQWVGGISEWSGVTDLDDSAETTGTTNPLAAATVTPTADSAALIIGSFCVISGDFAQAATASAPWTELHDEMLNVGFAPLFWSGYQIVASASGSYTPTGDRTAGAGAAYSAQSLAFSVSGGAVNGGPSATDGDDATYAGPATEFQFDLGAAYRIRRAELRLAWENTGSRTVTIYGANVADFSDEVELDAETISAAGSWTAQDETMSWDDAGTFRYLKLTVSVTARLHGFELYEASIDDIGGLAALDDHLTDPFDAHDASAVSYDGYESGLDATDVQAAIDEHIAEHPSGGAVALDDLTDVDTTGVADGDLITFDSADSTWKPVAPGTPTLDYGEDGDISTLDYDDTPAAGASDEVARADHVHGMPSAADGGGVAFPLDEPPGSPHAKDDEFDGASLDGKWTDPITSAAGQTNAITFPNGSWMVFEPATTGTASTGKRVFGIRQAAPTGSFTIRGKFIAGLHGTDVRYGLFCGVSGAKGHVVGPSQTTGTTEYIGVGTISNTADWSGFDGSVVNGGGSGSLITWAQFEWDASASTLRAYISNNGVFYKLIITRTSMTQPDQIGIVMYSNSATVKANEFLACEWFRVTEP